MADQSFGHDVVRDLLEEWLRVGRGLGDGHPSRRLLRIPPAVVRESGMTRESERDPGERRWAPVLRSRAVILILVVRALRRR